MKKKIILGATIVISSFVFLARNQRQTTDISSNKVNISKDKKAEYTYKQQRKPSSTNSTLENQTAPLDAKLKETKLEYTIVGEDNFFKLEGLEPNDLEPEDLNAIEIEPNHPLNKSFNIEKNLVKENFQDIGLDIAQVENEESSEENLNAQLNAADLNFIDGKSSPIQDMVEVEL